jgi:hypothetical protein
MWTQQASTAQEVAAGVEAMEITKVDDKAGKWKTVLKVLYASERSKEVR